MKLEVIWSEFAEFQLEEIHKYYKEEANLKIATKLVKDIINSSKKLSKSPYIGQREIRLAQRKIQYRYLIHKHYKIIYSVDENNKLIRIADVFDTRQYPPKIDWKK